MESLPTISIAKKSEKIDDSTQSLLLANLLAALQSVSGSLGGRVRFLSLSGNSYSEKACEEISKSAEGLINIHSADFNDMFVGRLKTEIPQSVRFLTKSLPAQGIARLDLSNNAISVNGAEALYGFLTNAKTLKTFYLSNCGLGIMGSGHIAKGLLDGKLDLEELAMARNRLEEEGGSNIAKAVEGMPSIRRLVVFQNFIRDVGMQRILLSLANKENLEHLDVNDNCIRGVSVEYLCTLIKTCPNLVALNVSDCNIVSESNQKVLKAIQESKCKLHSLGYNYNELGDDPDTALRFIKVLLEKNPSLKRLDITGNDFNKKVRTVYEEVKKANPSLRMTPFEDDDEEDEEENQIKKEAAELGDFTKLVLE